MRRLGDLLFVVLLAVTAAGLAFLSTRHGFEVDWSQGRAASLSEAELELLAALEGPVEITSFARPGPLRAVISAFFEPWQRARPDLSLGFVDPDSDPAAMRAAGIRLDGEMTLAYRGREQRLSALDRDEFARVLLRLARGGTRVVAFIEGQAERSPVGEANADLGRFMQGLRERGIEPVLVAPATGAPLPDNADLVVVAGPRVEVSTAVTRALVEWLDGGGHLLWLTEPESPPGLEPLAAALGVQALPGTLVDGSGEAFGLGDPSFVAIARYPEHAITHDLSLVTLFPQPAALARHAGSRWAAAPFLQSSERSWNETGAIEAGAIAQDPEEGEVPGPLDLGLALTRLSPLPGRGEQRAVVIGDGDFLSNSFLANGGNQELGERVFDWLLGDSLPPQRGSAGPDDRTLHISQSQLAWLGLGFLLGLPLLLAAAGGAIALVRRRR